MRDLHVRTIYDLNWSSSYMAFVITRCLRVARLPPGFGLSPVPPYT